MPKAKLTRYKDVTSQQKSDTIRRLEAHIHRTDSCWVWTGPCMTKGYGQLGFQGKRIGVHRLSVLLFKKEDLRAGLVVRHLCHNVKCLNPDHLCQGTYMENFQDRRLQEMHDEYCRRSDVPDLEDVLSWNALFEEIL